MFLGAVAPFFLLGAAEVPQHTEPEAGGRGGTAAVPQFTRQRGKQRRCLCLRQARGRGWGILGVLGKPVGVFWGEYVIQYDLDVLERQKAALQACLIVDSKLGERLREIIGEEMKKARDEVVKSIQFKNGDPRGAAQSVRRIVYKRILGGNINILNRQTAGRPNSYEAPRKLVPGQRGGNRMVRSKRTDDILHYGPVDRGFILRMVNAGTNPRYANGRNVTGGKNRNLSKLMKLQEEGDWYRGSISGRNFFGRDGQKALEKAMEGLVKMIDREVDKVLAEN